MTAGLTSPVSGAVAAALIVGLAGVLLRLATATPARALPGGRAAGERPMLPGPTATTGGPDRSGRRTAPEWWNRRQARAARRNAWPAVADQVGASLRSGTSLQQAVGAAAQRDGPVAARLAQVVRPIERGDGVAESARRWAEAADDADERLLAGAVELAAGATRAEPSLFDTVAQTMRERAALAGELRAQTAQARASAMALCALPVLFTGLCSLADPEVLSFLLGTIAGWACLAVGGGLELLGLWWMQRTIASVTA